MNYLLNYTDFLLEGNRVMDFLNPNAPRFIEESDKLINKIILDYQNIEMKITIIILKLFMI